ncbi:MAG: UDP-N-acetylglucosamine 2-epimerase, partial [Eubacteriales bacterium]
PCFGVLADYTCIPFFGETGLDYYFIPHSDLTEELVSKGMNPEQLIPTGIPVNPKFSVHTEKMQARSILELPLESKIVLVMTGGVGCGKIEEICDALPMADERCLTCVLTGHNKDMKARLEAKYDAKRLRAFGFTDKVNLFMNAADAMITKPGGLSSTEAAVACVPTVHLISVPGCEQRNAAFFAARGLSLVADSPQNAARLAVSLANDCEAAQQMRKRQHEHINPHAAEDIARKVMQS